MPASLPPLNAVRAFEATARLLSFARAAEELGVTQGAISKQILLLEDHIGARLFERSPTGLRLTREGVVLRDAVSPSFRGLESAFGVFRRRPPKSAICRLSTVTSFASQFLAPRLMQFEEEHADISLEISTTERVADLTREEIDLCVRYGPGGSEQLVETPLAPGLLAPVAAPRLARRLQGGIGEAISPVRRIQLFPHNEWRIWSKAVGTDLANARPARFIEDFVVAIEMVRAGDFVALLPEILVREHLANGVLVQFSQTSLEWPNTYYTAHLPSAERRPVVRKVLEWLRKEAAGPTPPE